MRLDWTDLQVFLRTCEAGSMTAAARQVHLTVAAVSTRLRNLEQTVGAPLLQRHARGVVPTPAGEALAQHARRLVHDLAEIQRLVQQAAEGATAPRLVLLANSAAMARGLTDVAADTARAGHPLLVHESASDAAVQALRCGAAQVAIVSDAAALDGLAAEDLGPDPLVLLVPASHAWGHRDRVTFEEALQQPDWIAGAQDSALQTHLAMQAARLGRRLDVRLSYPRMEGVVALVAAGLGISVLPAHWAAALDPQGRVRRLTLQAPWAQRRLWVARHAGDTAPATRALVDSVRRCWRTPPR